MKKNFTLFLALCLIISSAANAQFSKHETINPLKKGRERSLQGEHYIQKKEANKASLLKKAAIIQHPSSSKHYDWLEGAWIYEKETFYDEQGREIEVVSGLSRTLTQYNDLDASVTTLYQQKADESAPWITYRQIISRSTGNSISETWELVGGDLVITSGMKIISSASTVGNTTTEIWEILLYNTSLETYQRWDAYKDETLVNDAGQTLSYHSYFWEGSDWVLDYSDTYTYNGEGVLTQMTFCYFEEGVTECERIELQNPEAGAPESAYYYLDEGAGFELTGRYINLEWKDWENVAFNVDDDAVVLNATLQTILDPDGDINSDANYINFEQFTNDVLGNYTHMYWINETWMTDEYYFTETLGNGDVVTTSYYYNYEGSIDETCDVFLAGEKEVMVTGTNHSSSMDYEWMKTSEPCGYEWVLISEETEDWTDLSFETTTRYLMGGSVFENHYIEEWNSYGHIVSSKSTEKTDETIDNYAEYQYDNTYDGSLRTTTIITFRDSQTGTFSNREKIEYTYGGSTSLPTEGSEAMEVFPTVFNNGFNVNLPQASTLKLISVQGQTVWQQGLTRGQLFVPANQLPQGMYLLLISSETGETKTIKLLKK